MPPSSTPHLVCQHCRTVFSNMKALQIHIYIDHQTPNHQISSNSRYSTASAKSEVSSGGTHPTIHNGELLAAARMVNLQQQQEKEQQNVVGSSSRVSVLPDSSRGINSSSSRDGSVNSGSGNSVSSDNEEKPSLNCDLCGMTVPSRTAYKQVKMTKYIYTALYVIPNIKSVRTMLLSFVN